MTAASMGAGEEVDVGTASAPTIKDVARVAGVSSATVSRVLNAKVSVRDETRGRVHQAIALLGYERNEAAVALRRGRSA